MKKLVYALIIVLAFGSTGCVCMSVGIRGNGIIEKRIFDLKDFENITLPDKTDVTIVQGGEYMVEMELDGNLYEFLDVHVSHGTLHIGFVQGVNVRGYHRYAIRIQLPSLASLHIDWGYAAISGFTDVGKEMRISHTGPVTISVDAVLRKLEIEATGSGTVTAKGHVKILSFNGSGPCTLNAFELESEQVNVDSSWGEVNVTVKNSLQADLSGPVHLRYKGDPSHVMIRASGYSKVERVE